MRRGRSNRNSPPAARGTSTASWPIWWEVKSSRRRRDPAPILPAHHHARTFGTIPGTIIAAILVSALGNPRRGWGVFAQCFFTEPVLVALGRTLLLTALGGAGRLHHYARGALRPLPPIACREVLVKLGILRLHAAAPAISVAAKAYPATARTKRDGGRVEAHGIFKSSGDRPCCAMLPRPTSAFQAAREGKTRLVGFRRLPRNRQNRRRHEKGCRHRRCDHRRAECPDRQQLLCQGAGEMERDRRKADGIADQPAGPARQVTRLAIVKGHRSER